ncbi:flagellar hook-basal body protein [Pueribacillus sp. YX66]|uniref:flagellar hook-basal body protein n=1 Tax=Pueribacillus sp. YX66 TaxID=3229242 RepID=UPI00358CE97A
MNRAMIASSVTLGQLQHKLDTVANNLANLNTNGFKRRETSFSDLLVQQMNNLPRADETRLTPLGIRSGTGAAVAGTTLRLEQGTIKRTDRMLDLALTEPQYFFQVLHNGETQYTRDGAFYFSESRPGFLNIVTGDGAYLLGTNGPIEIPMNYKSVTIRSDGQIEVTLQNDTTYNAGQLALANVHRPQYLQAIGHNRFAGPNENSGIVLADVLETVNGVQVVSQGVLEMSNVDLAHEMNSMIEMQRHFQLSARSLTIADEMMGLVNRIR